MQIATSMINFQNKNKPTTMVTRSGPLIGELCIAVYDYNHGLQIQYLNFPDKYLTVPNFNQSFSDAGQLSTPSYLLMTVDINKSPERLFMKGNNIVHLSFPGARRAYRDLCSGPRPPCLGTCSIVNAPPPQAGPWDHYKWFAPPAHEPSALVLLFTHDNDDHDGDDPPFGGQRFRENLRKALNDFLRQLRDHLLNINFPETECQIWVPGSNICLPLIFS